MTGQKIVNMHYSAVLKGTISSEKSGVIMAQF